MRWRQVGVYVVAAVAFAGVLVFQGAPWRHLPWWVGGFLVMLWGGERLRVAWRKRSRSVAIASVAIDGEMLVISRAGQALRARRLADGSECSASSVPADASAHEVAFEDQMRYDDIAHLWLEGDGKSDLRRTLKGLQPAPATPIVLLRPQLVIAKGWRTKPIEPLPIFVLHAVALDDERSEQLTKVALGGATEWTVKFDAPLVRRARWIFITTDRVVLVLRDPAEAVALSIATGAVAWRGEL